MPAAKKTASPATKSKTTTKRKRKVAAKNPKLNFVRSSDYKGSKIEVVMKSATHMVQLDGKLVDTDRDPDSGAYVSPDLPYQVFGSLEEIAQAVVDTKKGG